MLRNILLLHFLAFLSTSCVNLKDRNNPYDPNGATAATDNSSTLGNAFVGNYTYNSKPTSVYWASGNVLTFVNEGGDTSTATVLSSSEAVLPNWANYHAKLSSDQRTITFYTSSGSLAIGTGTPWIRK